jgi:tetratricopeptide (TPR) repeat protein
MFWVGKKHFVSIEDYENRYMEVNPKDLLSPELKEFLSTIPNDETSRYTILGDQNYENGEYRLAVENYTKALKLDINNLAALFYRGLCFIPLEKFNDSITDLTKLLQLKPEFIQAYQYRANARVALRTYNQLKEAIADYTKVTNHDPSDGSSYFLRGYCYLLLGQEDLAILDWKKAKEHGIVKENEENWKRDYFE